MTTMKHEAATDVATFAPSNKETLPETKALLNQVVADLYVAHIALHQVHWYMRGRGFMVWHPKMDEYMVVLPEAHPLCVKEKIEIENLENEPFMLSEHGGKTAFTRRNNFLK